MLVLNKTLIKQNTQAIPYTQPQTFKELQKFDFRKLNINDTKQLIRIFQDVCPFRLLDHEEELMAKDAPFEEFMEVFEHSNTYINLYLHPQAADIDTEAFNVKYVFERIYKPLVIHSLGINYENLPAFRKSLPIESHSRYYKCIFQDVLDHMIDTCVEYNNEIRFDRIYPYMWKKYDEEENNDCTFQAI